MIFQENEVCTFALFLMFDTHDPLAQSKSCFTQDPFAKPPKVRLRSTASGESGTAGARAPRCATAIRRGGAARVEGGRGGRGGRGVKRLGGGGGRGQDGPSNDPFEWGRGDQKDPLSLTLRCEFLVGLGFGPSSLKLFGTCLFS